jgi:hypothetical protein
MRFRVSHLLLVMAAVALSFAFLRVVGMPQVMEYGNILVWGLEAWYLVVATKALRR